MRFINYNGRLLPASAPVATAQSRALRYGYGVFETMLYRNGRIELSALHWERLFASLHTIRLSLLPHQDNAFLEQEVHRTVRRNGLEGLCRVRLQVMAGEGGLQADYENQPAEWLIECFALKEAGTRLNENGLVAGVAQNVVKERGPLSHLKTCNALVYALAAREALAHHWDDAFVRNSAGRIGETTIANVFWLENGALFTPPLSEGCIAGVMRSHLLQRLPELGWVVKEAPLTGERLMRAEEVFLTNAIRRIRWIRQIGNRQYSQEQCREIAEKIR